MYDEKDFISRIESECGPLVFLEMLQEECAELIHAISKYKRAIGLVTSPTPIEAVEASRKIRKEITDVQMMIDGVLYSNFGIVPESDEVRDHAVEIKKWNRWLRRLYGGDSGD